MAMWSVITVLSILIGVIGYATIVDGAVGVYHALAGVTVIGITIDFCLHLGAAFMMAVRQRRAQAKLLKAAQATHRAADQRPGPTAAGGGRVQSQVSRDNDFDFLSPIVSVRTIRPVSPSTHDESRGAVGAGVHKAVGTEKPDEGFRSVDVRADAEIALTVRNGGVSSQGVRGGQ